MAAAPLFTIPIPPIASHPGGTIVCTEPDPAVYLLTFTSPPDNRLTRASCQAFLDALDTIELGGYAPGVVVTTSGIPKFYSNGLDLELAVAQKDFIPDFLYKLFARLLTYPMPTIALLNGHAFAGGLMLAIHHDYRVQNPTRGFVCINELEFGVPLKAGMSGTFRAKLPPATYRHLVLEARRFGGPASVEAGLVDAVGGLDEVRALVRDRRLTEKAKTGVYGLLKAEMYREPLALLGPADHEREDGRERELLKMDEQRKKAAESKVKEILGKTKL
ncbi:ClpP/crotonase [Thozetella sp. PMI_491]|nr:ClpP/crotonase [Thozetella sp. PMI_491]